MQCPFWIVLLYPSSQQNWSYSPFSLIPTQNLTLWPISYPWSCPLLPQAKSLLMGASFARIALSIPAEGLPSAGRQSWSFTSFHLRHSCCNIRHLPWHATQKKLLQATVVHKSIPYCYGSKILLSLSVLFGAGHATNIFIFLGSEKLKGCCLFSWEIQKCKTYCHYFRCQNKGM